MLRNILVETREDIEMYDPYIDDGEPPLGDPAVFFIGTNHEKFFTYSFPEGSVVIDPWRRMPKQKGVRIVRVGDSRKVLS